MVILALEPAGLAVSSSSIAFQIHMREGENENNNLQAEVDNVEKKISLLCEKN